MTPQRREAGLRRRLRLHFVRQALWERDNPQVFGHRPPVWGAPWTSVNALANFSFACLCHKRERYDRRASA